MPTPAPGPTTRKPHTPGSIGPHTPCRPGWPDFPLVDVQSWHTAAACRADETGEMALCACGHYIFIPSSWPDRQCVPCGECALQDEPS